MPESSINLLIGIDPETKRILKEICATNKEVHRLLGENKKLLSEALQASLKIIETSPDASERIPVKLK